MQIPFSLPPIISKNLLYIPRHTYIFNIKVTFIMNEFCRNHSKFHGWIRVVQKGRVCSGQVKIYNPNLFPWKQKLGLWELNPSMWVKTWRGHWTSVWHNILQIFKNSWHLVYKCVQNDLEGSTTKVLGGKNVHVKLLYDLNNIYSVFQELQGLEKWAR
jgi:hypothetical protein